MSGSRYSWGFRGASRIPNDSSWPDSLQVGQWRDVLPLFEGKIKVRFRITDFPGETVLHLLLLLLLLLLFYPILHEAFS